MSKIRITIIITIVLLSILVYISFFKDNEKPFLANSWISTKDPIFYHYFSKNKHGYTVEIHDKTDEFASKEENGVLNGNTLTFNGVDESKNIYTYDDGIIYVSNISRKGVKSYFTPLERNKNGNKK